MRVLLTVYFLVFCGFCYEVNTGVPPLCSDFIKSTDIDDETSEGFFDIALPRAVEEGLIEVTISMSKACQRNSCSLTLASTKRTAKDRYRNGLPVYYYVTFLHPLHYFFVRGITVRGPKDCIVMCSEIPNHAENLAVFELRHKLSLGGQINSVMSGRDLIHHKESKVLCGVVPRNVNFIHSTSNGSPIRRGSWPWLAAIYRSSVFACQGTVITNRMVLTIASCIDPFKEDDIKLEDVTVILGRHNLNDLNEEGYVRYNLRTIRIHPYFYQRRTFSDGDIALLITDRKIMFSETVRPACITRKANKIGTVVGWRFGENWSQGSLPIKDEVPIVPHDECWTSRVFPGFKISNRTFCGDRPFDGPGLGLYTKDEFLNRWSIRGLAMMCSSSRDPICDPENDVVDISEYFTWIIIENAKMFL